MSSPAYRRPSIARADTGTADGMSSVDTLTGGAAQRTLERMEPLVERFTRAERQLHLVGGVVRDLLLDGSAPTDVDATTDARPDEIVELISPLVDELWTTGARFGTIAALVEGIQYEITTYRAEHYDPASRKPRVVFGDDLAGDLERRDFTINAMAAHVGTGAIVDPHDGRGDLSRRWLRTPLEPGLAFDDDPLRMLRAARFVSRLGLRADPHLVEAMRQRAPRVSIVSAERVHDELLKLLATSDPVPGLVLLEATGLLARVLPGACFDPDLLSGRGSELVGCPDDALVRLSLLMGDPDRLDGVLSGLRFSRAEQRTVRRLVGARSRLLEGPSDDSDLRRMARELNQDRLRGLGMTALVDPQAARAWDEGWSRLAAVEDLDDRSPVLDGQQVMSLLGIGPGPDVGRAIAHLDELRLRHGPLDHALAVTELRRWWAGGRARRR